MNINEAPPPSPTQQLASALLGEDVATWIGQQRADGQTWRQISRHLNVRTGGRLDVTEVTLRNWVGKQAAA